MQDPGLSLSEVHALLDSLEEVRHALNQEKRRQIPVAELWDLCEVVFEVVGYGAIYNDNPLGINASILNKLKHFAGDIDIRSARVIAERARSYLRSQDDSRLVGASLPRIPESSGPAEHPTAEARFAAEQWIAVSRVGDIKEKISLISELLDNIIIIASRTNLPPDELALTELERAQLIAILETALNVLKSPLVEKGLLSKAGGTLKIAAARAAKKGFEIGLEKLMVAASTRLLELVRLLF